MAVIDVMRFDGFMPLCLCSVCWYER